MGHPSAHPEVCQLSAYGQHLFLLVDITRNWRGERHITGDLIDMTTGYRDTHIWVIPPGHDRTPVSELVESILTHEVGPINT